MTKASALHSFFSSFGLPAFVDTSVPDTAELPYLTYSGASDAQFGEVSLTVRVWYYSDSESIPNEKAEEIGREIDSMHPIPCDGGYLWLRRGSPFCVSRNDPTNKNIKLRYMNVNVAFLTQH